MGGAGEAVRRIAAIVGGLAIVGLAILVAPLALGLCAAWFVVRGLVYLTAKRAQADIVGWAGAGDPEQVESAIAYPILAFVDADGVTRTFTSRFGFRIHDDPPPAGPQPVRYHLWPRLSADLDDPSQWFAGPALAVGLAIFGTVLAWMFRRLGLFF
jgi:hypothetical protein